MDKMARSGFQNGKYDDSRPGHGKPEAPGIQKRLIQFLDAIWCADQRTVAELFAFADFGRVCYAHAFVKAQDTLRVWVLDNESLKRQAVIRHARSRVAAFSPVDDRRRDPIGG